MAQSGWRLSPELLKRVRVRAAEEGVRQNAWVERALESALGDVGRRPSGGHSESPAPSRAPAVPPAVVKAADEESMRNGYVEGTLERAERPKPRPKLPAGVKPAREFVLDPRQAALNKAKGS